MLRLLFVCGLAAFPAAAFAAEPVWSRGGPEQGSITVLVTDPQHPTTVYAGTLDGGIWKTTDGAAHWKPALSGLPKFSGGFLAINAIAVDPTVSSRVYAATKGLYKSDDGGTSWTESGADVLEGKFLNAIAIAPSSSTTVLVGTSSGVYKSTDAGVNWNPVNTGLVDGQGQVARVLSLAIHPQTSSSIIAGTNGAGTFLSTNGGQSWAKFGGNALDGIDVTGVKADPGNASSVYAFSPEIGVFHLVPPSKAVGPAIVTNGFPLADWQALLLDLWIDLVETLFCGGSPCDLWWEILFWAQFSQPSSAVSSAPFAAGNSTEILVTTSGKGIFHSLDGGATFTAINDGLPSLAISAITGDAGQTRYAGSGLAGVAKTTDDTHWTVANTGLFASEVFAVAASKSSPSIVYAATGSNVFKSSDAGVSWQNLTSIGIDQQVWPALAVDPTNPSIVYAATDEKGVLKTTNGGSSWAASNTGIDTTAIECFAIVPSSPQTIYAGTGSGIFKATDGGAHWSLAGADMPASTVRSLTIDPANVQTIFAGTDRGIFRSTDAGAHWADVTGSDPFLKIAQVHAIAVDPAAHTHVYLATSRGFYRSTDGGTNWTESDADIPSTFGNSDVPAVVIEPGSKIDIGSIGVQVGEGNGVYRSTDGGTTWTPLEGLTNAHVAALAVSSGSSPILYAGTVGGGVFRSPAAEPPPPPGKRRIIPVHPAPPKKVKEPRP